MTDLIKDGNEVLTSINTAIRERLASPIWGTFFIAWSIAHWQVIYVTLFIGNESILSTKHVMKDEYIRQLLIPSDTFLLFSYNIIVPALITFLVIWVFPKWIFIPAFKKEYGDYIEKKKYKTQKDTELEEQYVRKLEVEVSRAKEEKKAIQEDPKIGWDKDFRDFQTTVYADKLPSLISIIYEYDGQVFDGDYGQGQARLEPQIVAYFDALGVINHNHGTIELTDKGKYFIAQSGLNGGNFRSFDRLKTKY